MSKNFIFNIEIKFDNIFIEKFIFLCFPLVFISIYRFYHQLPLEDYIINYGEKTKTRENNINKRLNLISSQLDYFIKLYLLFFSYFIIKEYLKEIKEVNLDDLKIRIYFGYYSFIFISFICLLITSLFIKYFTWFSIINYLSYGIFFRYSNNYASLLLLTLGKINIFALKQRPWKYSASYKFYRKISSIIPLLIVSKLNIEYIIKYIF